MHYAENTKGFQFCHFCYCILFPKYAIMLLVKSKNNALVPPFAKKRLGATQKQQLLPAFSCCEKVSFGMGKCGEIRLRAQRWKRRCKAQRKVNSYEDCNKRNPASERRKAA